MILDEIAAKTRKRVALNASAHPVEELKQRAYSMECNTGFPFEKALKKDGMSFICEVKKASPSKGIIAEDFPYMQIAGEYEKPERLQYRVLPNRTISRAATIILRKLRHMCIFRC